MIKRTWCDFQSLRTDTGMWKGRKNRNEQMFPSTHFAFLSSGMGKARGQSAPGRAKAHHRKQTRNRRPCSRWRSRDGWHGRRAESFLPEHPESPVGCMNLEFFVQETHSKALDQTHSSAFRTTQGWVFNFTLGLKLPPKWSRAIQELRNSKCISLPFQGPHLLETDFKPFSAHWAFCLSPFLATTDWLLLYQECSPAYPGHQHSPELWPCDLYHKIWLISVLFFYMLPLFPLLLSLHCWEALWPGTLRTFILCCTSPSLFVMQGVQEICDQAWN